MLFVSALDWWETRQRFQHLVEALESDFQITVLAPRPYRRLWAGGKWREALSWRTIVRISPRQEVVEVPCIPRFPASDSLIEINRVWWARVGARAIGRRAFDVVWTTHPWHLDVLRAVPHRLGVYDCVDFHAGFWERRPRVAARIEALERRLATAADLVLASSASLCSRLADVRPDVLHVKNGVEVERFAPARGPGPLPEDLGSGADVGYYGAIGDWVDVEMLDRIAMSRPGWRFVFIGPVSCSLGDLPKRPNVRFLGPRPYNRLVDYLRAVPVWLLPFRQNALTEAVDPLKVYEYLAGGRRVVATPLPALADVASFIEPATSEREFVSAIERALEAGPQEPSPALERALEGRSWREIGRRCREEVARALEASRPNLAQNFRAKEMQKP